MTETRAIVRAAFAAAAANLAALAFMGFALRRGLPGGGSNLSERAFYIASHRGIWIAGWLTWNLAAITLLAFYVALAARWRSLAPRAVAVAVLLAAAGIAADLSAEAMFMTATQPVRVEDIAVALTGYVGNGLYTVAGIILTFVGRRELPRVLLALGAGVWLGGVALSGATLARSSAAQAASTAIVMPLFVVWAALVGRWFGARAS